MRQVDKAHDDAMLKLWRRGLLGGKHFLSGRVQTVSPALSHSERCPSCRNVRLVPYYTYEHYCFGCDLAYTQAAIDESDESRDFRNEMTPYGDDDD